MGDILSWLFSFFLLVAVLGTILYQGVLPEFTLQGALCILHLVTGHWLMVLICLPYLYYNIKVYTDRCHLVDVTEIFNQLPWEKRIRLYKLGYLVILLAVSIFWMVWSIVDDD